MTIFKKILKILSWSVFLLFVGLYVSFYYFTLPKSDEKVLAEFEESVVKPKLTHATFKDFEYRKLSFEKDTNLPTIVFVHGTIGSCLDFSKYIQDKELSEKANFISYDRVGYNYHDKNNVQESIAFEASLLEEITKNLPKEKTILVGYSYGGPIALAVKNTYKSIVLLAPAVYSKVEPMPWMINLYNWKMTRWLVPGIWKQAAKEKLTHQEDLQNFEKNWQQNLNTIISIHGKEDAIVLYENSNYLKRQFSKEQFQLMTLDDAGHGLIWSHFDFIQQQLLNQLD
jgi:pimeloyl-ACP methyl ester carboxylesterase